MHMADALLSPQVGVAFMAASGGALAWSARKVRLEGDDGMVPLMGVTGAFVFAAQMVNFAIPGTGSSGHLGGGMLLAMLLGPHAAFLVMASVLVVQALFFADGGLLALGANIWNMGFYPCALGWPLYLALAGPSPTKARMGMGATLAVVVALEAGAFSVSAQTWLSGRSELPFAAFAALMLGVHLPIALIESLVTIAVVNAVHAMRPGIAAGTLGLGPAYARSSRSVRPVALAMLASALVISGVVAWLASSHPDGLEWTVERLTGRTELGARGGASAGFARVQEATTIFPDYELPGADPGASENWPRVSGGTSVSGVTGSLLALGCAGILGLAVTRTRRRAGPAGRGTGE
jgi:cobalt/nickel transport system permease protein